MLCSCEDHGLLFKATDKDDSDEVEEEVEDVETTQDEVSGSVLYMTRSKPG